MLPSGHSVRPSLPTKDPGTLGRHRTPHQRQHPVHILAPPPPPQGPLAHAGVLPPEHAKPRQQPPVTGCGVPPPCAALHSVTLRFWVGSSVSCPFTARALAAEEGRRDPAEPTARGKTERRPPPAEVPSSAGPPGVRGRPKRPSPCGSDSGQRQPRTEPECGLRLQKGPSPFWGSSPPFPGGPSSQTLNSGSQREVPPQAGSAAPEETLVMQIRTSRKESGSSESSPPPPPADAGARSSSRPPAPPGR